MSHPLPEARLPPAPPAVRTWQKLRAWLPALLWAAVLFALSSIPGHQLPSVRISLSDKMVHCFIYGVLGGLLFRAITRSTGIRSMTRAVAAAAGLAVLYGMSDEFHQMFVPQRTAELLDLAADAVGGTLGALVACRLWGRPAPQERQGSQARQGRT